MTQPTDERERAEADKLRDTILNGIAWKHDDPAWAKAICVQFYR